MFASGALRRFGGTPQAEKAFAVGADGDMEGVEAGAGGAVGGGSDPFGGALGGLGGLGGGMGGLGGGMPGGMPPGVTPEMYQKMMKVREFDVRSSSFRKYEFAVQSVVGTLYSRDVEGTVKLWLESAVVSSYLAAFPRSTNRDRGKQGSTSAE